MLRTIFQKLAFLFVVIAFLFSSCKNNQRAKELPQDIGQYVYGFTSGTISKKSEVRVQFVGSPASAEMIGTEAPGILKFSPKISGKAVWQDAQTLVFKPETHLTSGQSYVSTVQLSSVFSDIPAEMKSFQFDFIVRNQLIDVNFSGMEAENNSNLSVQQLKGNILTADAAKNESVEKIISAKQNGKKLQVVWTHQPENLRHDFLIKGIRRTDKAGSVEVSWNGSPIGASGKNSMTHEVPALGDFKVSNINAVAGEKPFFQLFFSDPLDPKQDLKGLINIKSYNGKLQFAVEGNEVKIYPRSEVAGDYEVVAEAGIKSLDGSKMKIPSTWNLTFQQKKPAVRLVGNGVIIPQSNGLTFPFEAVGLNAVEVEVFKIYNNNILQFLQNNNLKGNYELNRVGRVVLQKKVALNALNPNATTSNWTRYALDLSKMIDEDPQAIYQVSLGFRPEYSTYSCSTGNTSASGDAKIVKLEDRIGNDGEIKSIWSDYYGISGYFDDYDWGNRDNPCFREYYNSEHFVRRNVLASNLGITVKEGRDGEYFIAVADLRTAKKIGGVKVDFYDYQQQLIKSVTADSEGMLRAKLDKVPHSIVAKNNMERGYMNLQHGASLSLSKFDVSGQVVQKGVKGFFYGERGVWRPGDSLFLNFILEDETGDLPENHPITFELKDSRGQMQETFSVSENVNGIYPIRIKTDSDAPTGNWLARVKIGGADFSKSLKIETVKPNRLKLDLDFEKDKLLAEDNSLTGKLQVNWLHGAPAGGLKAKVEMQVQRSYLSFKDFKKFYFKDPARKVNSSTRVIFDKNLDENGFALIKEQIFRNENRPAKAILNFKARAFEKGGDFSSNSFSLPFYPYTGYVGVKLPQNRWGHNRFDVKKDGTFEFASVDYDGNPLKNKNLSAGVYFVDWNWWYDRDGRNVAKFNSSSHLGSEQKIDLKTNAEGMASWTTKFKRSGRYLVRVCDNESGHCSGTYFWVGYPYYDNDEQYQNAKKEAVQLAFSPDKETYKPGDVATINVPSGEKGTILLTVENGSGVIESSWRDVKSGNNEIRFNITKEMMPNVYAHVSLIQPHAQTENDLPIRMYGVAPVKVEDPATKLKPVIKMPDVLEPEQVVNVEISEENGKDMAYTIAIVDDGLLDLTRFKTPDPHRSFYAKEALGVKTWDVYDNVLGAFGGELERILAVGGDDAAKVDPANQKANRFKPVVRHAGPFFLPKGSKKSHKIKMPNYVGSVRTMVVACKDGAYGNAEKTTPVRKPLMLLATLPRVLSPGEKVRLPVNVFAMEKKIKNVKVNVKESSGLINLKSTGQSLRFQKPGDDMAYFEFEVSSEKVGVAKFDISANGHGESASQQIEIQVRNPNPYQSRIYAEMLEPGETWDSNFELVGMLGTNSGVLEVSNIPAMDLDRRLKYLIRYPYGCVEQTTSSVFPQLYLARFVDMDDDMKREISENVQIAIDKLKNYQNNLGGFNYWRGGSYVNHWASTYAGHFLVEASKLGYTLPPGMLENWKSFQKKTSELWKPASESERRKYGYYSRSDNQLAQAYRLYTLALSGSPETGAMNRLRGLQDLKDRPRWLLAAAYAASGKKAVAKGLIKELTTEIQPYRRLSGTFGSRQRDKAIILEALTMIGDKDAAAEVLETVCEGLRQKGWLSTQGIAYSLLAVGKFIGDFKPGEDIKFAYKTGSGTLKNEGTKMAVFQKELEVEKIDKSIRVKNTSGAPLFVRLSLSGQPMVGDDKTESSKLAIDISYRSMAGGVIDPSKISQGTDFYARVTVRHPGIYATQMEELALEQVFPAGWEIINTRMDATSNKMKNSYSKFQDFRDDRVNTFFDLGYKNSATYSVLLNAAYKGRFYHPAVSCEAMYDNSIFARKAGMWVEVN